ncbi:MAG: hypothetical protein ABJA66_04180 [Actinomycetota bacterium]
MVDDADKLVEFVEQIFNGKLLFKMQNDADRISRAEMEIGDSVLMLSESSDEWKATKTMLYL